MDVSYNDQLTNNELLISLIGVCYGMQLAVIEFARDVLGWKGNNPL